MFAGGGQVIDGVALETVTLTVADVVWRPKPSRARAESVCVPAEAVEAFQLMMYGATVSSAPRFAPSSRNWTPTTPMSSSASAATDTFAPLTLDPFAGAVRATVGAVRSLATVTLTVVAVPVPPLVSRATAVRKCVPLVTAVVSHETEYGLTVSSAPRFAPSSRNCTPAMVPPPGVAFAVTLTVAATVDKLAGAVIDAVAGGAAVAVRNDVA